MKRALRRHGVILTLIVLLTIVAAFIDLPRAKLFGASYSVHQGLDLRGGTHLIYEADMTGIEDNQRQNALRSVVDVIERRINSLGVSEPNLQAIKVNNKDGILVELPGIQDIDSAVRLIGQTAQLKFITIDGQEAVSGRDLQRATVTFSQQSQPGSAAQVSLAFNAEGAKKFAVATKANIGKPIAIVLDNQIISAPTVESEISDGNAVITGKFTIDDAKKLAIALNSGALPVPLTLTEQRNVGATLGDQALRQMVTAGLLGFLAVAIFMIVLYRLAGVVATVALILYTMFALALFKTIPVTLTLAGIVGFILSVGMAVDANILIFERMREEQRKGKSVAVALEDGFRRAWASIRDSNVSSILTALILIWFGTGMIRGFAITLLIGIIVSLFTAITISRTLLRLLVASGRLKMIGRPEQPVVQSAAV